MQSARPPAHRHAVEVPGRSFRRSLDIDMRIRAIRDASEAPFALCFGKAGDDSPLQERTMATDRRFHPTAAFPRESPQADRTGTIGDEPPERNFAFEQQTSDHEWRENERGIES